MSLPNDPGEALRWATDHTRAATWLFAFVIGAIVWTMKRMGDWNRRNAAAQAPGVPPLVAAVERAAAAKAGPAAQLYQAAAAYASQSSTPATYKAAPAYAPQAASASTHRRPAPAQRAATPAARSVDVPRAAPARAAERWTLVGAFGDPGHARTAIVIAEVLGPPVALR